MRKEVPFEEIVKESLLARRIVGFLLKEPMSQSDLARKIYRKQGARSGISSWLEKLHEKDWIERKPTASKSILYNAKLEVLGNFDDFETKFIHLVIKRFWNPLSLHPFESLTNILITMALIKKTSKIKDTLNDYNPKKDFEFYKTNKREFWEDDKFRDKFLDKLKNKYDKSNSSKVRIRRDLILVSLMLPTKLTSKLDLFDKSLNNPLQLLFYI